MRTYNTPRNANKHNIKQHISAYNNLNKRNKNNKNENNNGTHTKQFSLGHRRYTYTQQQLCQALQTYQLVCKTRQQSKKSMRTVAREYNIPWSTFQEHVHKLHTQQQSVHNMDNSTHTISTLNNNQPPTASDTPALTLPSLPCLPPSTLNNNINNNNSSLTDIHATHEMKHNSNDILFRYR